MKPTSWTVSKHLMKKIYGEKRECAYTICLLSQKYHGIRFLSTIQICIVNLWWRLHASFCWRFRAQEMPVSAHLLNKYLGTWAHPHPHTGVALVYYFMDMRKLHTETISILSVLNAVVSTVILKLYPAHWLVCIFEILSPNSGIILSIFLFVFSTFDILTNHFLNKPIHRANLCISSKFTE